MSCAELNRAHQKCTFLHLSYIRPRTPGFFSHVDRNFQLYKDTLPAGFLWDSTQLRCRCWEGQCRLRWTWLDGWTERLSSENNHTNTLQLWVQLFPNITFPNPMETEDGEGGLTVHLYTRFWEYRCQQFIKIVYLQSASWHGVFFYVLRRIPAQGTRLKHVRAHKLPLEVMNEPVCWGWWRKKTLRCWEDVRAGMWERSRQSV